MSFYLSPCVAFPHSTLEQKQCFLRLRVWELQMYYEWNEVRFRRQYFIKFASAWIVAITLAFLPVWWLVQETTFP